MLNELKAPELSKFVVVVMFFVSVINYTNLNAIIFLKKHMTSRPIIIIKGLIIVYHGLLTHAERVRHFFIRASPGHTSFNIERSVPKVICNLHSEERNEFLVIYFL